MDTLTELELFVLRLIKVIAIKLSRDSIFLGPLLFYKGIQPLDFLTRDCSPLNFLPRGILPRHSWICDFNPHAQTS